MFRKLRAALRRIPSGIAKRQTDPRTAQSSALNYASVNTLDPSRLARAFAAADQGYITDQAALFELIEDQDAHLFGELAKRRRAVTGLGWQIAPPPEATQSEIDRVRELENILREILRFEDAQYDLTDAIGKGFAALEIDWQTGETWRPRELIWVPQRLFRIGDGLADGNRDLHYLDNGVPEALRPWGWIVHEHRAKSGYIEQAALFRVLAWTYAYKAYDMRDMQRFLEVYGLPLRLGKYPSGIGEKERDALLRAVRGIGHDGAGVVPAHMAIEFIQAQKTGTVDDFLSAIEYWERKQSIAILGGTLTSQADGKTSTNALGEIHDRIRREIMLHDVRQIEPTINRDLIVPLVKINGLFPGDRMPKFAYLTEESVDQAKMVAVLEKASAIGMQIGVDYAHEVMQIPRAEKGADILRAESSGGIPPPDGQARGQDAPATLRAVLARETATDLPAAYASRLAELCAPFEDALVQQIAAIVAESADFDEAAEKIAALKRDEGNYQAWATAIAEGMAAAHLAGRDMTGDGK
ncbi:MAG: DUF935 domain-containing protein [Azoarcus sp.]|jgi:phage gp29-like protein|nr:DUF935 domain-containing protein [Azoarcus sp.]